MPIMGGMDMCTVKLMERKADRKKSENESNQNIKVSQGVRQDRLAEAQLQKRDLIPPYKIQQKLVALQSI